MHHANRASSRRYDQLNPLIQIWSLLAPKIKHGDRQFQGGDGQITTREASN